jgi:hypothetical protein
MMRVVRAIERTLEDDQKVWITSGCMVAASDLARRLSELFAVGGLRHGRGKVSAMIPDDRRNRLIVIADERAYVQIRHVISACPDIDLDASEDTDGPVEVPEGVPDGERE